MYVYLFLLYVFEYVPIVSEALNNDVLGAEKIFEEMWQRDGGGRVQQKQPSHPPRRERDVIEPKTTDQRYVPDDFHGVRSSAIFRIENVGDYVGYDLKHSYGVRLQSRMILTICSAVTYVKNKANRVTYSHHVTTRVNVTKVDKRDITVYVMTVASTADTVGTKIQDILIHPNCDNQLEVDVAVLVTTAPLPESRNVWIHTAENLLFRRNLDRVVAAQAVLGKCTVPVYKKIENEDKTVSYSVDYVRIHFQHWDGCEANVCPYWEIETGTWSFKDRNRCDNLLRGTRYCMAWTIPESLCNLSPGTPVFCDVGHIHGLMGFLLNETYSCFEYANKNSIMQGLNDAIPWLWEALSIRLTKNYDKEIPEWLQNLRQNYSTRVEPRIKPLNPTTLSPDVTFNNFLGQQALSMVNVYFRNQFRCHGAMVEHRLVVVPCSCIGINRYADMTKLDNIIHPHALEPPDEFNHFTVSLMVNGSQPRVVVGNWLSDRRCNSHGAFDTALIELREYLPNHKLAWLMTDLAHTFGKLLMITAIADSSMGYNCYWMSKNFASPSYRYRSYVKTKIRFVHWTRCINNVCPNEDWTERQEDRCYGHPDPLKYEQSTQFCIESAKKEKPACNIRHGTPIFCNVESARGFVGLITMAMDLNETPCSQREPEDQTAVFQGIDKFLPDFSVHTWIHEFEERFREYHGEHEAFSFSLPIVSSSVVSMLLVLTIIFIIR